jgi:hypothetical protein
MSVRMLLGSSIKSRSALRRGAVGEGELNIKEHAQREHLERRGIAKCLLGERERTLRERAT